MRRIDLQVVNGGVERERRRRGLPTCASNGMRQCPAMAPRRLKTSVPVTQYSSLHLRVHTPSCPVSCGGAEQGSNRTDCSASSARQISGQATEWYVTGPLLPRGPSDDDLKSVPTAKWLPSRGEGLGERGEAAQVRHHQPFRTEHAPPAIRFDRKCGAQDDD